MVICRCLPFVHSSRFGQGPQIVLAPVTTIASVSRWRQGIQDALVLPSGQVPRRWSTSKEKLAVS